MHISVESLNKKYQTVHAVKELSFEVSSGEIFTLLGPNGAGKSSTIKMLIGLASKDSGLVQFTSKEQKPIAKLRQEQFGYLPEERGLYQDTSVKDTLVYFANLKGMRKSDALSQISHWLKHFELEDRKNHKIKTLSKGNQQKVQLISSIIHSPELVILDEPFSGLDPINQEKVISFLNSLKAQGTTILLSAHQMALVERLADKIMLMSQGQKVLHGTMDDIKQQSELGSKVILELKAPLTQQQLSALRAQADIAGVEQPTENRLLCTLSKNAPLPEILKQLLQNLQVDNLQTQQPELHDIYLHAINQDAASQGVPQ